MKEAFIDINTLMGQTQPLHDMELQSYLSSLGSSAEFTTANVPAALSEVLSEKKHRFTGVSDRIMSDMHIKSLSQVRNIRHDIDSIRHTNTNTNLNNRQYEINEWENSNKLDTLFFLQILLICTTFITVMMFLKIRGIISEIIFIIFAVITGLYAILSLVIRGRYTSIMRDSRYWHKARFPSQSNPYPTPATCPTD